MALTHHIGFRHESIELYALGHPLPPPRAKGNRGMNIFFLVPRSRGGETFGHLTTKRARV